MEIVTCTRRLEWDAGHRVLHHGGKCRHLHGHRYVAEVTVQAIQGLNDLGMVVDFSCIKSVLGTWIDEQWDHNMMLHAQDPLLDCFPSASEIDSRMMGGPSEQLEVMFAGKAPYIMPVAHPNPTAENIALVLLKKAQELLTYPLHIVRIRVYETPNCFADVSPLLRPFVSPNPTPTLDDLAKQVDDAQKTS